MQASAAALSLLAYGGAVVAPGLAVVLAFRLGRGALERLVLALPIGRVLLTGVTLVCAGGERAAWLRAWPAVGVAALAAAAWHVRKRAGGHEHEDAGGHARTSAGRHARSSAGRNARPAGGETPPRGGESATWAGALAAAAAALLLVAAVVGRSGLADADGTLHFLGRDSTDDPIVYAAAALRLLLSGLPLTHPFAAGAPATAQYLGLAGLAGLHAISGVPMLDLAFRCLPAIDAVGAALAAVALARALGATPAGAGAAGVLLVLGGGAAYVVPWLGAAFGRAVQPLDTWAFFGPYLLAFNPIAAALGGLFAAFLLIADPGARARSAPAVCAGLLVASLFETKLFLFAPAFAGLAATALLRPPTELARPLRVATALALAGALPSLVEKALAARGAAGVGSIGFALCPGCLPRYLLNASLGSHDVSFGIFKSFRLASLLDPGSLLAAGAASGIVAAVALGARALALPELWRAFRGDRLEERGTGGPEAHGAGERAVLRWIAFGSAASLVAGLAVAVPPHFLNGAQFAWFATFALWPVVALPLGRWLAAGRLAPVVLCAALALPSGLDAVLRLGFGASLRTTIEPAERALCEALAERAGPDDAVIEPSLLLDLDRASPIPFLAGRAVHLSLLSVVQSLPAAERDRRFEQIVALFAGADAEAAARSAAASGARFVVVPAGFEPRAPLADFLEPSWSGPGGRIYRVPEAPPAAPRAGSPASAGAAPP